MTGGSFQAFSGQLPRNTVSILGSVTPTSVVWGPLKYLNKFCVVVCRVGVSRQENFLDEKLTIGRTYHGWDAHSVPQVISGL
jgi:hypothetical protein